jgi:hypothetical protein
MPNDAPRGDIRIATLNVVVHLFLAESGEKQVDREDDSPYCNLLSVRHLSLGTRKIDFGDVCADGGLSIES